MPLRMPWSPRKADEDAGDIGGVEVEEVEEVEVSLGLAVEGAPAAEGGSAVAEREEPVGEGGEGAGAGEIGEAGTSVEAASEAGAGTAEGEGEAGAAAAMEAELRGLDEDREAAEAALRTSFAVRRTSLEGEAKAGGAGLAGRAGGEREEAGAGEVATGGEAEPTMEEPSLEELIALGIIKNLDTGEVFSETTSVRNLDTGEIMSVEQLASVYAGACQP